MLILPSISQLNEVIKTSQAIINSPIAAAIRFASSMRYLLQAVYPHQVAVIEPLNIAAALLEHVNTGPDDRAYISHSKVKVTWGDLQPVDRASALSVQGGIRFTWHDNTGEGNASADNRSVLIAYNKNWNRFFFNIQGAERNKGSDILPLSDVRGQSVHTWLAFISADEKEVSDSVYTGKRQVL